MPEKTKRNKDFKDLLKEKIVESPVEKPENNAEDTLSKDQREKGYYYDDSYGYEIYNPEDEENDE